MKDIFLQSYNTSKIVGSSQHKAHDEGWKMKDRKKCFTNLAFQEFEREVTKSLFWSCYSRDSFEIKFENILVTF